MREGFDTMRYTDRRYAASPTRLSRRAEAQQKTVFSRQGERARDLAVVAGSGEHSRQGICAVELTHMYVTTPDAAPQESQAVRLDRHGHMFATSSRRGFHADRLDRHAASLRSTKRQGTVQPIHGSAPDIAERTSPIRCGILAAAMMLRFSFDQDRVAPVEAGSRK